MKSLIRLIAPVVFLSCASLSSAASLLTNGSFEAVDASASPYYIRSFASTPGWTQFNDGVDLVHNNYSQPNPIAVIITASDGVQYLDMNQAGNLGGIFQDVAVTQGSSYLLTLDSAAWAINGIGGTLGYDLFDPINNSVLISSTFNDNVGGTWHNLSLSAAATSNTLRVRIYGLSAPAAGMGVDNVALVAADAPEPGTFALLALAGTAVLFKRRRK